MLKHLEFEWRTQLNIARILPLLRWIHPGVTRLGLTLSVAHADFFRDLESIEVAEMSRQCNSLEEVTCSIVAECFQCGSSTGAWAPHVCALLRGSSRLQFVKGVRFLLSATLQHL